MRIYTRILGVLPPLYTLSELNDSKMFGGGEFKPKSAFVHTTLMGSMTRGERMTIDFNMLRRYAETGKHKASSSPTA
ncbi:hypothetical protein CALCODRAFT_324033 [Calocera cornea HHB12733]|uniref:Uncharacterized protein n=1 Tax=Calocera cornea HHB12733 TaxID=1353952 RepID=A0A165F432_9BASI|nr:hypothetical protein CALCODRAFT_324033 [Calocera cornea HHB12733]